MNQKLFFYWFHAVLSPSNAQLNIGAKNHKIVFDEMLGRSFVGAWTCDRQSYMSLTCVIFFRRYLFAGQQIKWEIEALCLKLHKEAMSRQSLLSYV